MYVCFYVCMSTQTMNKEYNNLICLLITPLNCVHTCT